MERVGGRETGAFSAAQDPAAKPAPAGALPPAHSLGSPLRERAALPVGQPGARTPAQSLAGAFQVEGCEFERSWQRDASAFWKPWLQLAQCETHPGGRDLSWGGGRGDGWRDQGIKGLGKLLGTFALGIELNQEKLAQG